MKLTVPMPENIANAKMRGWRGLHARKVKYYADLDRRQAAGLIPPPPKQPFASVVISATMYLGAAMDQGNAMHRCEKWPCDWLKTRGYIADDSAKCLRWAGLPNQIVERGAEYRIEIELTPI